MQKFKGSIYYLGDPMKKMQKAKCPRMTLGKIKIMKELEFYKEMVVVKVRTLE